MRFDRKNTDLLYRNFSLLCRIIAQEGSAYKADISGLDKIINEEIPDTLKDNAPQDYYELYTDFKSEYEKFKDFILYDKLIGRQVVALGGGFSCGKSSFLNALDGERALPEDTDPSTSVPTYIVNGEKHHVQGINIFDTKVEIDTREIRAIAHGFGDLEDEDGTAVECSAALGHILESIFLQSPKQIYKNLAFLDTPGYSKPDSEQHSARTDEKIARRQLNSANFILWFVQADSGVITDADIEFIKTLREDIPKLIILNKADKKPEAELTAIKAAIKNMLTMKGIRYMDVLAFSSQNRDGYDAKKIRAELEKMDSQPYTSQFARNFKVLFLRCRDYFDKEVENERRQLSYLNTVVTRLSFSADGSENIAPLKRLIEETKENITRLTQTGDAVKALQDKFFTEIKRIGDIVGIDMPEPGEIDLINDSGVTIGGLVSEYAKKRGIKPDKQYRDIISQAMRGIEPVFAEASINGNDMLAGIIRENCVLKPEEIRFGSYSTENIMDTMKQIRG